MEMFEEVPDGWLVDVSYTASYSPVSATWDSFHDYVPNKMFNTRDGLFSFKNGNIYRHNEKGVYAKYYDSIKPSYITPVFSADKVHILVDNVVFRTECINQQGVRIDKTFNSIVAFNSYQASGKVIINVFDESKTIQENYNIANTRRVKSYWLFNKFRDYKANELIRYNLELLDKYSYNEANIVPVTDGLRRMLDNFIAFTIQFDNKDQEAFFIHDIDINFKPADR